MDGGVGICWEHEPLTLAVNISCAHGLLTGAVDMDMNGGYGLWVSTVNMKYDLR